MELSGALFSPGLRGWAWIGCALLLLSALRMAPWRRLRDSARLHAYLATCIGLLVLWTLRTEVVPGLAFHLLGITTLTLMVGWSLTVIGASLVLAATALGGAGDAPGYALNLLTVVVVPAALTQVLLVVVRGVLPRHFFIYVFVNAFLTAGLAALAGGCVAVLLLSGAGGYAFADLQQQVIPFFPLMFFPEALLNGWIITLMVALHPGWVWSFSDEDYLHGK